MRGAERRRENRGSTPERWAVSEAVGGCESVRKLEPGYHVTAGVVERRTALTVLLAVAAVLALGVSAATLNSTTSDTASGGFGAGSEADDTGVGDQPESGIQLGDPSGGSAGTFSICVEFFRTPEFVIGLAVVGLVVLGALYRTTRSWLLSGMALFSLSIPVLAVILLFASCGQGPSGLALSAADSVSNQSSLISSQGGGDRGSGGTQNPVSTPTSLLGIVLLLAIVGSIGLLVFSTGDDEEELAEEPPEPPEPEQPVGIGAAAGVAADRLEDDADLENAVYRAWREMTRHLEVDHPHSSTPAEFAAAAVDAGMKREDVDELTDLFERVRYGGTAPTERDERQAIEALRNIEETYTDGLDTADIQPASDDASVPTDSDDPDGSTDSSGDSDDPNTPGGAD